MTPIGLFRRSGLGRHTTSSGVTPSVLPTGYATNGLGANWTLVWSDEFNGTTVDRTKWNQGWSHLPPSPGLGYQGVTGSQQTGTYYGPASLVFPGNGSLHEIAQSNIDTPPTSGAPYSIESGSINTNQLMELNVAGLTSAPGWTPPSGCTIINGSFVLEFRAQMPGTNADYWPAVWLPNAGTGGYLGEIDMLEGLGSGSIGANLQFHLHAASSYGGVSCVPASESGTDFSLAYHVWTFVFTNSNGLTNGATGVAAGPWAITCFVDEVLVPAVAPTQAEVQAQWASVFFLTVSNQQLAGAPLPNSLNIDYVRIWTPGIAPAASAPKIVSQSGVTQLQMGSSRLLLRGLACWCMPDHVTTAVTVGSQTFADQQYSNIATFIATVKAAGGNTIRVRTLAQDLVSGSYGTLASNIARAQAVVAAATAQNMIVVFTDWDPLDSTYSGSAWAGESTRANGPVEWFTALVQALGPTNPNVLYCPFNEPNNITWAQWQSNMQPIVTLFRSTLGYYGPLMMDPIGYANSGTSGGGYDNTNYTTLENYDAALQPGGTQHQIFWSSHQYYGGSAFSASAIEGAVGFPGSTAHAICFSEVGNVNTGVEPVNTAWSSAAASWFGETSYTAMANACGVLFFLGGPWSDANALFNDDNATWVSPWGTDVQSALQGGINN